MSRPSRKILPAVGRSTPVNRLMSVVLPAPFGPISAWRAPFWTARVTSSVATMPPKFFSSPLVSSTGGIGLSGVAGEARSNAPLERIGAFGDLRRKDKNVWPREAEPQHEQDRDHDAVQEWKLQNRAEAENERRDDRAIDPPEQDHHHQREAEPELPVLRRHVGEIVLHQLEQDGADQPAVEVAGAADDDHQHHIGGALEVEHRE